jgi:hypothetical protein
MKNGIILFGDLLSQSSELKAEDLDNNFRRVSLDDSPERDISKSVTENGTTLKLFYPVTTGVVAEKPGEPGSLYYTVTAYFSDGSGPVTEYSNEPISFNTGFGYWV